MLGVHIRDMLQGIRAIGESTAQENEWIPLTVNVVLFDAQDHTGMDGRFATVVGSTIGGTGRAKIDIVLANFYLNEVAAERRSGLRCGTMRLLGMLSLKDL